MTKEIDIKEDKEKTKKVTITLTPSTIEKAKLLAKNENRPMSNYISNLILEAFEQLED